MYFGRDFVSAYIRPIYSPRTPTPKLFNPIPKKPRIINVVIPGGGEPVSHRLAYTKAAKKEIINTPNPMKVNNRSGFKEKLVIALIVNKKVS